MFQSLSVSLVQGPSSTSFNVFRQLVECFNRKTDMNFKGAKYVRF